MTEKMTFDYAGDGFAVRERIVGVHRKTWERIAAPGSHWSGEARVEIARQAREARKRRDDPPWMRKDLPSAEGRLSDETVEAVRTIAVDAHKITKEWADGKIATLGEPAYVELGSIVATISAIDSFNESIGREHEPLPEPLPGEPDGDILEKPIDDGAFVRMSEKDRGPNVGRALSLVPEANRMFMSNVMSMYSSPGGEFWDMVWEGGPLDRPQAELIAARVSSVNECFY